MGVPLHRPYIGHYIGEYIYFRYLKVLVIKNTQKNQQNSKIVGKYTSHTDPMGMLTNVVYDVVFCIAKTRFFFINYTLSCH